MKIILEKMKMKRILHKIFLRVIGCLYILFPGHLVHLGIYILIKEPDFWYGGVMATLAGLIQLYLTHDNFEKGMIYAYHRGSSETIDRLNKVEVKITHAEYPEEKKPTLKLIKDPPKED